MRATGHPATAISDPAPTAPDRVGLDPRLLLGGTDDEILRCYLALLRNWRSREPRAALRLRQADVAVLVSILGTDSAEIERRLIAATDCTGAVASKGRRLLLASLGGALTIGLTTGAVGGAGTIIRMTPAATSYQQPLSPSPGVRSTRGSLDQSDALTTATTAPMPDPSASVPAAAPTQPAPSDGPSPPRAPTVVSPQGVEARVSIPSLGIDLAVIEGGQAVIDEGVVAHYEAPGWKDPVAAGAAGTYWLAAHHVTHGGPFAALPDIAIGAEIRIATDTGTFIYTVTSKEVVGLLPGDVAIYGADESSPVILLQTCIDSTRRLLVHGTLTATL